MSEKIKIDVDVSDGKKKLKDLRDDSRDTADLVDAVADKAKVSNQNIVDNARDTIELVDNVKDSSDQTYKEIRNDGKDTVETVKDIDKLAKAVYQRIILNGKETVKTVKKVEETSKFTFFSVLNMAKMAWSTTEMIVKQAGGTISTVFSGLISATFATISILQPLLTAEAVTPGMQATAALGFIQLGLTIAALVAAEQKRAELEESLRNASMALMSISSLIGRAYNF